MKSSGMLVLCFAIVLPLAIGQETANPSDPAPSYASENHGNSIAAPTQTLSASITLPEATPLKLKLLHSLNSKTAVLNDPLNFALAEDLTLNGKTLVKSGAFAIGRVRQATPARTMGRGAQLGLEMQYLKVGRVRVPLRGSAHRLGDSRTGDTVALVALFGLSGLLKHGSEIEFKEGSTFVAYVDQDTDLPTQSDSAPSQP